MYLILEHNYHNTIWKLSMNGMSYLRIENSHLETNKANIIECLWEYAKTKPGQEAVVFAATDGSRRSVTWSELYERSRATARSFIHLGIKKSEIVGINLRSCPELFYTTFGAMMAGAIPVSISFVKPDGSDLAALMHKLNACSLFVMDPGLDNLNWNIFRGMIEDYDANGYVKSTKLPYLRYLMGYGFEKFSDKIKRLEDITDDINTDIVLPDIGPDDIAALLITSGSTGVPKLVAHTHRSLLAFACSDSKYIDNSYGIFNDRPFSWIGGFPLSILTGQKRITLSGFCDPPDDRLSYMLEVIQRERCSMVLALPPLMAELSRRQNDLPSDWPVVGIMTGGQPMTKGLAKCIGKSCQFLCCLYAGTEFIGLTQSIITDPKQFVEYGCGTAILMKGLELKIVDDYGQIVPTGTRGEILARSPAMFKEYYNDPEKTKAAKSDDHWFKTDDMGLMTEEGVLFVEGRKSNVIISGAMKVAPEMLEQVIKSLPGVHAIVVVPVPDEVYHQVICACVIKTPETDITEEKLRAYCSQFEVDMPGLFSVSPKFYLFVEKFPETQVGKLDRKELQRIASDRFK